MLYPPKPNFQPLVTYKQRADLFGHFYFHGDPLPDNPEHVKIEGSWEKDNIIFVPLPLTLPDPETGKTGGMLFHKLAAKQLQALFAEWQSKDLLKYILTFDGSFVSRYVRGSTTLSNHAFGTAFDINYPWNKLGNKPTAKKGTVFPLVEAANKHGFFWGGHYQGRKDGMHFEVAICPS